KLAQTLLEVEDLHTQFFTSRGVVRAVDGVSFHVDAGETLGVVGESGCGKTMTALSILRLLPDPGKIVSGRIMFRGNDVTKMTDEEIRDFRGNDVAMIFQDPMTSLNPVTKIGKQIEEAMTAHNRFTETLARGRVIELLKRVRVPAAESRVKDYPHQFSGGMRQRAMIAMGLSNEPSLLISVPRVDKSRKDRLVSIKGLPPDLAHPPPGCKFHPRCPFVVDRCKVDPEPSLDEVALGQVARCWVLMRNVKEEDVEEAKKSALSKEAAEKLKASTAEARGDA